MIDIFQRTLVNDLGYSMSVLAEKNKQITRNVANQDTPLYRAKKLEFKEVMKAYYSEGSNEKLHVTNDKHIQVGSTPPDIKAFVRRQNNPSTRTDGNDVNIEYEMSEDAAVVLMNSMFSEMVTGKFTKFAEIIPTRS